MKSSRKHDGDNAYLHIKYEESKYTAENCIRFIECLPIPSGAMAGYGHGHAKLIKLLPWQKKLIRGIWPKQGNPRNEVLLSIARRNGKTVTLSAIMCFLMFNKHEKSKPVPGSLMASTGKNKDQACLVYNNLKIWCATVVELNEDSDDGKYHKTIEVLSSPGTMYKALSSSPTAALGGQYSVVVCDEVGFWKNNKLQLALRSGMSSTPKDRRLFLQSSTVPDVPEHFFFDELIYFADKQTSPTHYALVMMTDRKKDDPSKESTWKKANPSYGVLLHKESFLDEYESAKNFPKRMEGFLSFRCNAPCSSLADDAARFVSQDAWDACKGDSKLIKGEPIVVAWDAASTRDLTAVVAMSLESPHRTECMFIVPKLAVTDNLNIPYKKWADEGYCTIATTDYVSKRHIVDYYNQLQHDYDVVGSMSDNFGYPEIVQLCDQQSIPLDRHIARNIKYSDYNDGLEKLAELIRGQNIIHNNEVLDHCIDNLRIKHSKTGATIVDKELSVKRKLKIDGAICAMLCSFLIASNKGFSNNINLEGLILQ